MSPPDQADTAIADYLRAVADIVDKEGVDKFKAFTVKDMIRLSVEVRGTMRVTITLKEQPKSIIDQFLKYRDLSINDTEDD